MGKNPFKNFSVRYGAGERIFNEGDLGTTMYIVQSGVVRLFRTIDGERRVYGELEKGDFFGEMSILEGLPRTSHAEAVEDAELIEINSMTFDKMIKGNIEIAIRMLRKLSLRLRDAESQIESLATRGPAPVKKQPQKVAQPTSEYDGSGARLVAEEDGTMFLLDSERTMIGRFDPVTSQKPDVDLTSLDLKRSVSRRHAQILFKDKVCEIIEEVGALNGTYVNGEKLETGRSHPLNNGDTISLGMVKLTYHT